MNRRLSCDVEPVVSTWTLGSGVPSSGENDALFVALIGLAAALEVVVVLLVRTVEGRRRGHGPRSGYS